MKLYKTTGTQPGAPVVPNISWQGTQLDAKAARKAYEDDGLTGVKTEDVDVPVDKPGLLAWLNANCVGND